jgi:hypothetical protein
MTKSNPTLQLLLKFSSNCVNNIQPLFLTWDGECQRQIPHASPSTSHRVGLTGSFTRSVDYKNELWERIMSQSAVRLHTWTINTELEDLHASAMVPD